MDYARPYPNGYRPSLLDVLRTVGISKCDTSVNVNALGRLPIPIGSSLSPEIHIKLMEV